MTVPVAIVILPYVTNILIKLSSLILNRRLIRRSLENLAAIPAPAKQKEPGPILDANRRDLVVRHVGHATLIGTTVLTVISSFVATVVLAFSSRMAVWLLPIALLYMAPVLWWILPSRAHNFRGTWMGVPRLVWFGIVICGYDLILGAASVICLQWGEG